jgi:hypothetical protein
MNRTPGLYPAAREFKRQAVSKMGASSLSNFWRATVIPNVSVEPERRKTQQKRLKIN